MAAWIRTDTVPWLVTGRPEPEPVVGGVTFVAGFLHQPVEWLGVASLLGAVLVSELTRPVEGSTGDDLRVAWWPGQLDSSLVVVGAAEAVAATLLRADRLLAGGDRIEIDDGLRDRALAYPNPLQPWSAHLVARWPGHQPHLTTLGPLALDTLDGAALAGFVAGRVRPAERVYWTNEPALPALVGSVTAPVGEPPELPAPVSGRNEPEQVRQRAAGELCTVAVPAGPATELGLALLARALRRRLVEFEPLATEVRVSRYEVGGGQLLVAVAADLLPGKDPAAVEAARQTIEDLAAGTAPPDELGRLRGYADAATAGGWHDPVRLVTLARRHLGRAGFPSPDTVAEEYRRTGDEQVLAGLSGMHRRLLLATPDAPEPPPRAAEGSRFRDRVNRHRVVRCSDRRVSLVGRGGATESVDFDEVVLRLDSGDQSTTLVDQRLGTVRLDWGLYRRAAKLRAVVDRHTTDVPVVHQPADPEWPARLAPALRRARRRLKIGVAGYVIGGLGVLTAIVGAILDDGDQPPPPTVEVVEAGRTVTLPDGTTLGIAAGPELIERYAPDRPYTYAVQLRMCGGEGRDGGVGGTHFRSFDFRLDVGEQPQAGFTGIPERPGPRETVVEPGRCATGWLLHHLVEPTPAAPVTLHYGNAAGDRVTWRLPAEAADSPLSKPCPPPTVGWAGCPTPSPGG